MKDGKLVQEFNKFIEKWCGNSFPHLSDSDENDGERFRELLRIYESERKLYKKKVDEKEIIIMLLEGKLNGYKRELERIQNGKEKN